MLTVYSRKGVLSIGKTSNEAKRRYAKKTFKKYGISLRIIEDAELIAKIEAIKAQGIQTTEAIKQLINEKSK